MTDNWKRIARIDEFALNANGKTILRLPLQWQGLAIRWRISRPVIFIALPDLTGLELFDQEFFVMPFVGVTIEISEIVAVAIYCDTLVVGDDIYHVFRDRTELEKRQIEQRNAELKNILHAAPVLEAGGAEQRPEPEPRKVGMRAPRTS